MLHAEKDAPHIDGHDAVEHLAGIGDADAPLSTDPGVVEREIESPEVFNRAVYQSSDFFLEGHICTDEQAAAAGVLNQSDRLCSLSFTPTGDNDVCALFGESDRRCSSNSSGSAGD
jgi:hypothetical protein